MKSAPPVYCPARPWPGGVFLLLCLLLAPSVMAALPGFVQVKADWRSSQAWLLDRHGEPLQELRLDERVRRTEWTPLEAISPALVGAVLQAEDQRFYAHAGVDWLALGHATLNNLLLRKPRGASTLTMQLTALLDSRYRAAGARRSVAEKLEQMEAARALDKDWSKAQILEAYFNLLPMRGDLVGIDATARALFDKRPAGLGPKEAILIAALIRSPNAKPDDVARRACALARRLPRAPDCASLTAFTRNTLGGRYPILPAVDLAPQLARQLLKTPGQRLVSSLDAGLQRRVRGILLEQLRQLAERQARDAAALVLDNATGEVLAYVSVSGRDSTSPQSDGTRARRQAGSTLKPFLYALALERRYLTAASPLPDRPLALATAGGLYAPENYDHVYRGLASLRFALAGSLNIPAVHTLSLLGDELFAARLTALGFAGLDEAADFYGPSLALGSLDVSLWELANAYRALANGGRLGEPRLSPGPRRPGRRVYAAEPVYVISDILSDRQARAATFGLENPLATPYWAAVKTGTSKDMRDNWCLGYSRRYTVGVWVGNFGGEPMHGVSGVSGAAPAWRAILDSLEAGRGGTPPEPPASLSRRHIAPPGEPLREEWFLPGTEPPAATWTLASPPSRVLSPADGDILALDPDIPVAAQRLRLLADPPVAGSRWRADGQDLPDDLWTPSRGRHWLELWDGAGRPLDWVEVEVR